MQHIVVERTFEPAATPGSPQALEARAKETPANFAASEAAGAEVTLVRVLRSADGKHMVSLYGAPDGDAGLAAVHGLMANKDPAPSHVYPVHEMRNTTPERPRGYSLVVAQRDVRGMDGMGVELVQHLLSDPLGCGQRLRLTQFGAYLAHDLSRMICAYYAPDMESVRKANRENGAPWEHMWTGELVDP